MSIFDYFRKTRNTITTASQAKERLQIIVSHARGKKTGYLKHLQKELLAVIAKYVPISQDQVKVALEQNDDCSVLELNIMLPNQENEAATSAVDSATNQ